MATVTTTATDAPAWKLRLRAVADVYKSSDPDHLSSYVSENPSPYDGVDFRTIVASKGKLEVLLKAHASKLKKHHDGLMASSNYDGEFKEISDVMIKEHQACSDSLKVMTDELKSTGASKQTARDRMEEGRRKSKDRSNKSIDKAFDDAMAKIDNMKDENEQDKAVDFWEALTKSFFAFWDEVWKAFNELVDTLVAWLQNMWEEIKKIWNEVKQVWDNVWDWYSNLF